MIVQTSEATIVAFGEYGKDRTGRQIQRGDGSRVEFVDVVMAGHDDFAPQQRRVTLDRSFSADRPSPGDIVSLTCRIDRRSDAVVGYDGQPRVVERDKWTLLSVVPAAVGAKK